MDTLTILEKTRAIKHRDLTSVADATGVPRPTLMKLKYGQTSDPASSTVDRLRAYFVRLETPKRRRAKATA